jgi:hypothetical protein
VQAPLTERIISTPEELLEIFGKLSEESQEQDYGYYAALHLLSTPTPYEEDPER